MYSFQTLQDFVLNLLDDDAARAAYTADPTGALAAAGLGDLTPQDVEEVIPLVADALPADSPLDALGPDVDLDLDTITDGTSVTGLNGVGEIDDLAYVGGVANADADGTDLWLGAQSVGRLAGVVQTEDTHVEGGLSTPAVYAGATSNGDYLVTTADPVDLLDDLGGAADTATDTAAGTATHVVGTGAGTLAGAVDTGADSLAGFLAGTPAADAVTTGSDLVEQGLATGAGSVTGHLSDLPSAADLPVDLPGTDALPVALPEVPDLEGDLGELPRLGDLDLPAQLPDLPVELPDLGVDTSSVTDVVSDSPVADVVSASPVGGLTETAGDLPLVGDLTDDLNLGL